jgi:thioredoxin reductase
LEAAIALSENQAASNQVTLIYRKDSFGRASQKNIDTLQSLVEQDRIRLHLNSYPVEIGDRELTIQNTAGESQTLPNDFMYCMLGAEPPIEWLKSMGISFSEKPQGWSPGSSDDVSFVNT